MNIRNLGEKIKKTLAEKTLEPDVVLNACEVVIIQLTQPERIKQLTDAGVTERELALYLDQISRQLGRECLEERLKRELPQDAEIMPLGTLFHIAAGNAYGLPAFSVIEGLLAGNINLIKLPGPGDEVSMLIFDWLIEAEPDLADYIYVFQISSADIGQMTALSKLADAIVIWGGDEAVKAVRELADPNTRLIEWGHKISFAYADPEYMTTRQMDELADHICSTKQLYCSSCQGIYLNTDDFDVVKKFSEEFSGILEAAYLRLAPPALPAGITAQLVLKLRTRAIEAIQYPERGQLFQGVNTSVWAAAGNWLETSFMFGNCWVKPLLREQVVDVLRGCKNHLQTVSLYCREEDRPELSGILFRAGVCRVTTAGRLDTLEFDIPHDGEYALRKYCRIVIRE